jgi:predicted acylesterase/phospholipase RssA
MKGLSLSGASTKIPAVAGAAITILKDKGYKPDIITGVSAGSILAVPLAMGLYDDIRRVSTTFTMDDIFDIKPVDKKGNISIRAILRALTGEESLGSQMNLLVTLSEIITEEKFKIYQTGNYAPCYLGCVEFKTCSRKYVNVKDPSVTYMDYLEWVCASSSIPVFVESVKVDNGFFYDGGVRDHIGSHWLMENHNITEHVSVYSRPKDYNITDLLWTPSSVMAVLSRTLDIMNVEISKNDESREDEIAEEKGINSKKIFMSHTLSKQAYQIDPKELKEWYEIGVKAVLDQY